MGEHRARHHSQAGRIAGRGAMTAAAALALTGGTASLAFAAEAPSVDRTAHATEDAARSLAGSAAALPETEPPTDAAGLEKLLGDHAADVEHKVADVAGPAGQDLQAALNDNGVPVGERVTETEHEIVNRSGEVSERIHHETGSAAASLDDAAHDVEENAPSAEDAEHDLEHEAHDLEHDLEHEAHELEHEAHELEHEAPALSGVLSFA